MSVETIDVGVPPAECTHGFSDWEKSLVVRFHDFENLDATVGAHVDSPTFMAFGHEWALKLYPGGQPRGLVPPSNLLYAASKKGHVALCLQHLSNSSITTQFGFNTVTKSGKRNHFCFSQWKEIAGRNNFGPRSYALRSGLVKDLVDGSLVVEVRMGVDSSGTTDNQFIPQNPLSKCILSKFMDEKSSDIIFEVSSNGASTVAEGNTKRTKTSTTFYAHRFILQHWKGAVGEVCTASSGGDSSPIIISDVKPEIFRHLIYYSYEGKISDGDLKSMQQIIDASDRYGVVGLKLEAEVKLVTETTITMDTAMDHLLYADGKNCALLKEAVMDFLVGNI